MKVIVIILVIIVVISGLLMFLSAFLGMLEAAENSIKYPKPDNDKDLKKFSIITTTIFVISGLILLGLIIICHNRVVYL